MGKILDSKVEELKLYHEKPIGVFGARASGKTMFFTVLYGLSGYKDKDDKFSVVCNDEETQEYLRNNYGYLLDGKLPPRTEANEATEIDMNYYYNKNNYSLRSLDFAGELIGKISINDEGLVKEFFDRQKNVFEFFANCGGILIFLTPNENKQECFDRQNEVNRLLGMLEEQKGKWSVDLPVTIVLTKWDKMEHFVNGDVGTPEEEQQKAMNYVNEHPIYKNIYTLIYGVTENVKVFPLSAFGRSKDGDMPPDELNKPFNLFAPLVWTSKRRDKVWADKVQEILLAGAKKKDVKEIIDLYLEYVESEELLEEVKNAYKVYLNKLRVRAMIITLIIFSIIAGIAGYKSKEIIKMKAAVAKIRTLEGKEKIEKINDFILKYEEGNKYSVKFKSKKLVEYKNLIDKERDKAKKITYMTDFIRDYAGTDEAKKMENRKLRLQTEIDQMDKAKKIEIEYNILTMELVSEKNNYVKYKKMKDFDKKYPNSSNEETLHQEMRKYLKLAELEVYEGIKSYATPNNNNKKIVFEKIERYLAINDYTEYRQEIQELKITLKDDYLYLEVRDAVNKFNKRMTIANLDEISRRSESYLSVSKVKKYKNKVFVILEKIKKIEKGVEAEVECYVKGKNLKLKDKEIEIVVKYGDKTKLWRKSGEGYEDGEEIYMGSIVDKVKIKTEIKLATIVMKKDGGEISLKEKVFKFDDLNTEMTNVNSRGSGVKLIVKVNKELFEIK